MTGKIRPAIPRPDLETVRKRILVLLEEGFHTAREISGAVHIPEREVGEHLAHLGKSLRSRGRKLEQSPAECLSCGFVFRKREKFAGPGRCPVCRGEFIAEPSFRVEIQAGRVYNSSNFSSQLHRKEKK